MNIRKITGKKWIVILVVIEFILIEISYLIYDNFQNKDIKCTIIESDKLIEDKISNITKLPYLSSEHNEDIEKFKLDNSEVNNIFVIDNENNIDTIVKNKENSNLNISYNDINKKYQINDSKRFYILKDIKDKDNINIVQVKFDENEFKYMIFNINLNELLKNILPKEVYNNYCFRIRCEQDGILWGDEKGSYKELYSTKFTLAGDEYFLDTMLNKDAQNDRNIKIVLEIISIGTLFCVINYGIYILIKKNKNIDNLEKISNTLKKEIIQRRDVQKKYELTIEGLNDAIWECDYINKKVVLLDKWNKITKKEEDVYYFGDKDNKFLDNVYKSDKKNLIRKMKEIKENKLKYLKWQFRINDKEGNLKWISLTGSVLYDSNGDISKLGGSLTDITDMKIKERKIEYMAYHDYLTGLKNLKKFIIDIKKYIKIWHRHNKKGAVVFIDLDNFKVINDVLGHEYGNELLKTIALDMLKFLKKKNVGRVYRIAGDEFVLIIDKFKNLNELKLICNEFVSIFDKEFFINNKILNVTCSAGVAVYPDHSDEHKQLLINADIAMYKAKQNGKNRYQIFNCSLKEEMDKKLKIEYDLSKAIKNKEFTLHYQPKINIKTNEIMGYEALIRWYSKKDKCYIKPSEFIPIAEKCGLIEEMGYWIFEEVCTQINIWKTQNVDVKQIAINISPVQLIQRNFSQRLNDILKKYNINPKQIEIEITETTYIKNIKQNNKILKALRDIGISIALDDFGTGYSSLSYLVNIPLNTLKIDKSFIKGIEEDLVKKQIVQGIIDIAHNIQLMVVAEGVEKKEEINILKEINCDIIQGYYYSKPIKGEKIKYFNHSLIKEGDV